MKTQKILVTFITITLLAGLMFPWSRVRGQAQTDSQEAGQTTRQDGPTVVSREGRRYPVEPVEQFKRRIEENQRRLAQKADEQGFKGISTAPSPVQATIPLIYTLADYQTPIKNQSSRGTCWAFAGVAALEAAYQRRYGITLDLSEQYLFHIFKAGELYGNYATGEDSHENNSSYWGGQGASDIIERMQRFGVPEEIYAPYARNMEALRTSLPGVGSLDGNSTQEQLDELEFSEHHIPTTARWNAKYQVTQWAALSPVTTDALARIIYGRHEVVVDLDLRWKWDASKNAYDFDPSSPGGGHALLLVGYDKLDKVFIAKNSWGESDFIRLTYDFVENNIGGAYYIQDVGDPNALPRRNAFWLGRWNLDHAGQHGTLVIRRFTNFRDIDASAATKLGNYYRQGRRYDVNGYLAHDGQVMVFYIASQEGRIVPGTLTGQRFVAYLSSDPAKAGGVNFSMSRENNFDRFDVAINASGTDIALTGGADWRTMPVASSIGNGTFDVANYAIGNFALWSSQGAEKLVGDFNGDGKTDVALTGPGGWLTLPLAFSRGGGRFNVTNHGAGNFTLWASQEAARFVGDFNGDGKADIALVGPGTWKTLPVAFSNGDGTFTVTNHDIGNFAKWAAQGATVVKGDFNGDGKTDLALTGANNWLTLPVALSNGDGTFTVTNHNIGNFAKWAAEDTTKLIGDFNGDGMTDIALTGPGNWATLPVALSNGDGTFSVANSGVKGFAGWASQAGVKKITGDFNGDGKTDVALIGPGGWNTMPVALSNGDGTFTVTNHNVAGFAKWAAQGATVLAGDFNRDGKADVALIGVPGWQTLPVAFSNGDGTFSVTNFNIGEFAKWAVQGATVLTGNFSPQ